MLSKAVVEAFSHLLHCRTEDITGDRRGHPGLFDQAG
jgi:hypothetical protein